MDIAALREAFTRVYPEAGQPFVCRAPGRVNLIGEHTDYNGLPVLPMAMERGITMLFTGRPDGVVRLQNEAAAFDAVTFQNAPDIPPSPPGAWENYVKAAIQDLNQTFGFEGKQGMDMLVAGNLPMAAGLASSSALVVAAALAYLAITDLTLDADITRLELADTLAQAEHYTGTQGGGMDQAVILGAVAGHACKIDFRPLRLEQVPVFKDHAVVVCDSLVKAEKTGAARARYNTGPQLAGLITALVEKQLQREFDEEIRLACLGDLTYGLLCLTHREAQDVCGRAIPYERLTLADVAQRLDMPPQTVQAQWLDGIETPEDGYALRARMRHLLTEHERVEAARDALVAQAPETFGELMNASHESCAHDYGISCAELDSLVATAREGGAIGARLTGAGFGGATVNLVPADAVPRFVDHVTKHYYAGPLEPGAVPPILVSAPAAGAAFLP